MHVMLILAALSLIGAVTAQNYLVPTLRNGTISAGLTGPYHVLLNASYVPLIIFLPYSTFGHSWMFVFALIASVALLGVAVTNTAHEYVDKLTGGKHALWHSRFTTIVFVASLALEAAGNGHDVGSWGFTAASMAVPAVLYGLTQRSDYVEKIAVLMICIWLIVWAL